MLRGKQMEMPGRKHDNFAALSWCPVALTIPVDRGSRMCGQTAFLRTLILGLLASLLLTGASDSAARE